MNELFYDLVTIKSLDSYSQDQIKNIKLISTNKNTFAKPFGSATYRIQKYPGDLDIHEIFIDCCTIKDVINKFEKILKKIVRREEKEIIHYVVEVKAGLDKRYDVDIGELNNGIFFINTNEIKKKVSQLKKNNLLNKNEIKIINNILKKQKPDQNDYDILYFIFRERKILRWNSNEILQGYKILPGNKKITLNQALYYKTHVKIDVVTLINNRFIEITNFFILAYVDKNNELHMINLDYDYLDKKISFERYDKQIKEEIEKLYYSNLFYNPFKMAKRIWALARTNKDENMIFLLSPFITSNISFLYQIKSEIDAILRILKETNGYPIKTINRQIDEMKIKLSNIIEIDNSDINFLNKLINKFNKTHSYDIKVKTLNNLKNYIKQLINIFTIEELNKLGLNPPPINYLPNELKYENIVRTPLEIIKDPLKSYGV